MGTNIVDVGTAAPIVMDTVPAAVALGVVVVEGIGSGVAKDVDLALIGEHLSIQDGGRLAGCLSRNTRRDIFDRDGWVIDLLEE